MSKSFSGASGEKKTALDGVNLSVAAGSLVCLLGANGSGKTTLLKILCGLMPADSGRAVVAGFDLTRSAEEVRRRTGFSPGEERSFYGRLTGLENLRFFARLRGLEETALRARLEALDPALGLSEILPMTYQKTSAGMKQRLSLARALLHDPPILLLDEPTKSLDPQAAERFRSYITERLRGQGGGVLWSTHNVDEAWDNGGDLLILSAGRITARGTPQELLQASGSSKPRDAYRALAS